MIKAIDNFDISLNVQFSTYAVPMIIGEIKRFLRDNSTIRVSRSLKDTAYKAITTRETLMKKNLKEPSITEIAEEIGISKADIVIALKQSHLQYHYMNRYSMMVVTPCMLLIR